EFDREPPNVEETPQGLVFDGLMLVDDVAERLGVKLAETADVSTLGGFVTAQVGRMPRPGDRVAVEGYDLSVAAVKGRRVTEVPRELGGLRLGVLDTCPSGCSAR